MLTTKITVKGQATIPKKIRENLRLRPNDRVEYINNSKDHTCIIKKAPTKRRNFFNRKCLNPKNCDGFFHEINMQKGQSNVGKEGWK